MKKYIKIQNGIIIKLDDITSITRESRMNADDDEERHTILITTHRTIYAIKGASLDAEYNKLLRLINIVEKIGVEQSCANCLRQPAGAHKMCKTCYNFNLYIEK
jgi:hypothetical protein